ncbi:hypothetical protein J5N97_015645 [Dioscorea zingiberensis]|uniref:Uncharacterized protein n=1 Tax=Dioscorea zingiberensis TaxID=325984 RepID=A0A9D5HES8_9LILI|nr:hypothetical protein J5N97_015645 [Dioscorea zingiberensis]
MAAKQDDFAPHPVKEQLPGVDFCLASSPPWRICDLDLIFVQEEKARVIQTLLFVAGINTLLQSYLVTRLPAVIGGSFTFILPTLSIILSPRFAFIPDPHLVFTLSLSILCLFFTKKIILSADLILVLFIGTEVASCIEVGLPAIILLVFFSQSTGTLIAVQRYASATPVPPSIFSRGIGWQVTNILYSQFGAQCDHVCLTFVEFQGIAILLDGMFSTANGSAASVENAGLLGLTRVGSHRVIQISAVFMIFFSILGKFGALFASIPFPIVAALYCVLFAYTASAGLGFLQFCNLNSMRTKFILGFSLFMGLSVAQYFREYEIIAGYGPLHSMARWFDDMVNVIFGSPATVAAIVAYFLDSTVLRGDNATRRDRGWHWWEKFRYTNISIRRTCAEEETEEEGAEETAKEEGSETENEGSETEEDI